MPPNKGHLCSNSTVPDKEYIVLDDLITLLSIIKNLLTCPAIILLNALVIVAVYTKQRLQTMHNMLLTSLAGTDLALGIASQPMFIAREIFRLTGGSMSVYRTLYDTTQSLIAVPSLASLFHLVLCGHEIFLEIPHYPDQIPHNCSSCM